MELKKAKLLLERSAEVEEIIIIIGFLTERTPHRASDDKIEVVSFAIYREGQSLVRRGSAVWF